MSALVSEQLKQQAVATALSDMVRRGYFSISCIDSCAEILGIQCRGVEAYTLLRALHCVDFARMTPDIRRALPELIKQVLQFEVFIEPEPKVDEPEPKRGFLRRFLAPGEKA